MQHGNAKSSVEPLKIPMKSKTDLHEEQNGIAYTQTYNTYTNMPFVL